jgi:cyclopropane fatty-acyl-phospholipid synthase-like methyltransferase
MMTPTEAVLRFTTPVFEMLYGIKTTGRVDAVTDESIFYTAMPYPAVHAVLDKLALQPDDVFYDIGCGKGRVLCCAARRTVRSVVGVELNPALVDVARQNLEALRMRRSPFEVLAADATAVDYSKATAVYMYHPFKGQIMKRCLAALETAVPRDRFRLVYVYPDENEAIIRECGWLEKYDEVQFPGLHSVKRAAFWRPR